jgi:Fur family peroxide stress response transcriptional regulator
MMAVSREELDRKMRLLEETCRAGGLKVTHQRMEIFSELAGTDEHPDAETIYRRVHERSPAVSRDTVYRTLSLLEEKGLITKVQVSGAARYDANVEPHHHFVCTRCGLVKDFLNRMMDGLSPPAEVRRWGVVEGVRVQVLGVCRECMAAGESGG